jgi:hypothetical protein
MKHSFQQIIENQKKFGDDIISWLKNDFYNSKKVLNNIKEENDLIKSEKETLIKKFESINVDVFISSLFFNNSKRSKNFYAWWEETIEEVIIYKYANKERRSRKTPAQY